MTCGSGPDETQAMRRVGGHERTREMVRNAMRGGNVESAKWGVTRGGHSESGR